MKLPDAQKLAVELMTTHGLINNPMGGINWRFEFDRGVRRFGCTHWNTRKITLSAHLVGLNDEARVKQTILHEIAHALAGHKAGHGPQWQNICRAIGGNGQRLYSTTNTITPGTTVRGHCPNCKRVLKRHRRTKIACGVCCRKYNRGQFDPQYLIVWQ